MFDLLFDLNVHLHGQINQVPYSSVVLPTLIPSPRLLDQHSRLPHLQEVRSDDRKWKIRGKNLVCLKMSVFLNLKDWNQMFKAYLSLKPRTTFWMRMTLSVMALSLSISSSMSWWSCAAKQDTHTHTHTHTQSSGWFLVVSVWKCWKV